MAIFRHHLRGEAGALAGWAVAVLALVLLDTMLFGMVATPSIASQMDQALRTLPPQLVQFVGGSLAILNVPGWISAIDLSGWITLIVGIWVALTAVGIVTSDRDHRTLEFLLSLPVRRGRLLLERVLSLVAQLAVMYFGIFLAVILAMALIGRSVEELRLAEALGDLLLDQAALAGTLVLISLFFRDETRAMLATLTAGAVFVFIPVFVEPNSPVAFLRHATPFNYEATGSLMVHGTYPALQVVVAAIWAVAAFLAAWAVFARQEV